MVGKETAISTTAMHMTLAEARRLLLHAQGLDGTWQLPGGKEGAAQAVARLGYVQIDTIAVIERAHHHVLWTRHAAYTPAMLDELLRQERRVFEYWTHAAAYIPMSDYRYYLPKMRTFARQQRMQQWGQEHGAVVQHVLERIRAEGPLSSADFADTRPTRGTWWDWKPAKRALEMLFLTGELMIAGRRHFQRLYELTERVLPSDIETSEPEPEEVARFVVRRTLASQGLVTAKQAGWWYKDRRRVVAALNELVAAEEVVRTQIEGMAETPYYVWVPYLDRVMRRSSRRKPVYLLSPFDNLIIDRHRARRWFGFAYRLECYTPLLQRQYGYFTLPILWGDALVGRLDPKVERRQKLFSVRNLVFEPAFRRYNALLPRLAEALRAFAAFHGCEQFTVERSTPETVRRALMG